MVDGEGAPESSTPFHQAIEALYGTAYTLKFMFKDQPKPGGWFDYVVPPLEGLWWMKGDKPFDTKRPEDWRWTLMIMLPDFITPAMVDKAMGQLRDKKNPPGLSRLRMEAFEEGKAVQIMHIGPYDQEGPAIAKLHTFAAENSLELRGKHHEIYLSDPNRTAPEKMKTVLRQPVT
ncbi:MAG TPA: GyrI-like domain-containing protein, partial [Saprospiraceae bacterium]|nr:GyrI-like domain-containing protein [Saprospiraceae bacterium]